MNLTTDIENALKVHWLATEMLIEAEKLGINHMGPFHEVRIQARHDLDAAIEAEIAKNGQV